MKVMKIYLIILGVIGTSLVGSSQLNYTNSDYVGFKVYTDSGVRDSILPKSFFKIIDLGKVNIEKILLEDTSLCVMESSVHGVGLFTNRTYNSGQKIIKVFENVGNSGQFMTDYYENAYGIFVNHSNNPNVELLIEPDGIYLVAKQNLNSGVELVSDYAELLALFPNDTQLEIYLKFD